MEKRYQSSGEQAVQQPGKADVPLQIGVQEPETDVDSGNRDNRDESPLSKRKLLAELGPYKCQTDRVEQKMRPAKMHQMSRQQPPEFAVPDHLTVVAQ